MNTETINVELNGTEYEIDVSKIAGAIDSIDPAFAAQAARRMKRGRYTRVLEVLVQCDLDHEPDEITEGMMEDFVKEHFVEEVAEESPEEEPMNFYDSMQEYVQDADFTHYEITGSERETPFEEEFKPVNDPDFFIESDCIIKDGKRYRKVNFGESDESYLLESALYDTLKMVYVEGDEPGHYVPETGNIVMGE